LQKRRRGLYVIIFVFWEKNRQKGILKSFSQNHPNNLKREKMFKIFQFSHFKYHQIWENILMDDHHFGNITKLEGGNINMNKIKLDTILYRYIKSLFWSKFQVSTITPNHHYEFEVVLVNHMHVLSLIGDFDFL
jgi:hypothetical protein